MCASDELFMLYLVELDAEGRKAIQDFFYITRKYNFMTDELEKKEEMFIGVTKKYDSLFDPCTNSKIKKTAKLKKLSKWELIKMIEKYGIHKYIATKRQKPLKINYQKMVKKINKEKKEKANKTKQNKFQEIEDYFPKSSIVRNWNEYRESFVKIIFEFESRNELEEAEKILIKLIGSINGSNKGPLVNILDTK